MGVSEVPSLQVAVAIKVMMPVGGLPVLDAQQAPLNGSDGEGNEYPSRSSINGNHTVKVAPNMCYPI